MHESVTESHWHRFRLSKHYRRWINEIISLNWRQHRSITRVIRLTFLQLSPPPNDVRDEHLRDLLNRWGKTEDQSYFGRWRSPDEYVKHRLCCNVYWPDRSIVPVCRECSQRDDSQMYMKRSLCKTLRTVDSSTRIYGSLCRSLIAKVQLGIRAIFCLDFAWF